MVGVKGRYLYVLTAASGIQTRRCFIECDADHLTLAVGANTNSQPASGPADGTFNFLMPADGTERGRNAASRWVQVQFTGALPIGRSSPTLRVPVFRVDRYNQYSVGATGTYLGLPIQVLRKFDGRPSQVGGW